MPIPNDAFAFLFGSNVDWAASKPHPSISINPDLLSIEIMESGDAVIQKLNLFDDRDDNIARIEKNKLWVSPNVYRKRPDQSTLILLDHLAKEALKIELLNPLTIRLSGIFRYPGRHPITITDEFLETRIGRISHSCTTGQRGVGFTIN